MMLLLKYNTDSQDRESCLFKEQIGKITGLENCYKFVTGIKDNDNNYLFFT